MNPKKRRPITVTRMFPVRFRRDQRGWCWNDGRKVKAGDRMCSVGAIRRGRNWGDYGGKYCAACPYFFRNEKEAKRGMGR